MNPIRSLVTRVRGLVRRDAVLHDIDEELRSHVEICTDENVARGMAPDEARRAALASFGNVARAAEDAFEVRGGGWLDAFGQDLRYGLRGLLRNRGFAVVAVLTLGLGIGANTAVFSVVNAVFLRPLPFADPDQLVTLAMEAKTPGTYNDIRTQSTVFSGVEAARPRELSLTGDGEPERIVAQAMTAGLLPLLGVSPALGRGFTAEEDRDGGPHAVVISDGLWRRRYAGDRFVVGRSITLNGEPYTVVGVMPPGFQLLDRRADAWVPMAFRPQDSTNRGSYVLLVFARLAPGVSVEAANSATAALVEHIRCEHPEVGEHGVPVTALREALTGDARTPLLALLVAVALVLLIACINVGNLLLSRAAARRREITVRAALGASGGRVVRQLLVENVPLVACGTALGLGLAWASLAFLRQLIPPGLAQSAELTLDWRVLAFTLGVAAGATVLFGLVPALQVAKTDLNEALRTASARVGATSGGRLQSALVIGEVSLALALLVGASLLMQTFFLLRGQYDALDGDRVVTMKTVLTRSGPDAHARRDAFFGSVLERVGRLPGVVSAGYTNALPLDYKGDATTATAEGEAPVPDRDNEASTRLVTPDYMKALGIPLLRGRHFAASDSAESMPVAVVNEAMVRQYWHGSDPLGRRLKVGTSEDAENPWMTVVGVVADVRQTDVSEPAQPEMYVPYAQADYLEVFAPKTLAIRVSGDRGTLVADVRREIAAVDPNQPVSEVRTMDEIVGRELSGRRTGTMLLGAFAAVALLLASIGIYGLLAHRVRQMTPEIGVRLALGARPRDMLALVVWRGMRLVAIGTLVGLGIAAAGARLLSSLLFGVSAADPWTFVGVPIVLATVALAAGYVPGRQAARVDPNVALRAD